MRLFKLDKAALSLKGNVDQFLNGLTSNTLTEPRNAFLNIHGRIIATFDQLKTGDDEFLIIITKVYLEALLAHIDRYARLSGVKVELRPENVYFDVEGNFSLAPGDHAIPQKKGRMIITSRNLTANVSEEEFNLFRLKHNIPLHGIDFKDELILNVNETDFVSFAKGCFLGQEPVAKVHNRSKPTWKLIVRAEEECNEEEKAKMTSKSVDPATGKTLGFLFVSNRE